MKDTLLVIPAYNEANNIGAVIENLKNSGVEKFSDILIINDGSSDNTEKIIQSYGVKVLSQVFNLGYGVALQTAYKYANNKGYEYLIQMDADGQHDVCNVHNIYSIIKKDTIDKTADIVIGSRFLEKSVQYHMSGIRLFAVKMFRGIIKIVTKKYITDPTSGLQGLNRKAFSYYAGYQNFDIKYPDINMIIQMLLLDYKIEEIPAIMHPRTEGQAMHSGVIKPIKYMTVMMLSVFIAILRYRKKR